MILVVYTSRGAKKLEKSKNSQTNIYVHAKGPGRLGVRKNNILGAESALPEFDIYTAPVASQANPRSAS